MDKSLKQKIQERIDHAKERQQYWKDGKDIAKIWVGIESELTLVLTELDEATKQIQELFDDTDSRAGDYRVISVVRGLKEEVLAILEGKEKAKP